MEGADRPISERVVEKVADQTGRDPLELPPLYHSIDSEAVDTLVESLSSGVIQFTYANLDIDISSSGEIALTPR